MPNLVNPYRFGAGGGGSTVNAFIGATESTLDASTYTFTDHAIGTAHANRVVVVGVVFFDAVDNNTIDTVTIGGSSATEAANTAPTGSSQGDAQVCAIFYRAVAAGTTATIVVNSTGTATSCGIAVWAIYPASSTPIDADATSSNTSATSVTNTSLSIVTGGVACVIHNHNNSGTTTFATDIGETVVENVDEQLGDTGVNWAAGMVNCSTTSTMAVQAQWTGSVTRSICTAVWGAP